jgi:hypothetical protein
MGNDGGSIPKRRELVKEAARNPTSAEQKETQQEQQHWLWTTDPITNEALQEPVVSDCNGRLYKKESVLKVLTADESLNLSNGCAQSRISPWVPDPRPLTSCRADMHFLVLPSKKLLMASA